MSLVKRSYAELCLAAVFLGLLPLLVIQAGHLWERPHFQFFPLAWLAFAYLLYTGLPLEWTKQVWRVYGATALIVVGLATTVLGSIVGSPWLGQISAILWVSAWGLLRLAQVPVPRWLAWTSLLWVTLPLPLGYDTLLVQKLQRISSESAGALLDLIGTLHLRLGNLIEVRSRKLFVDEACSGVDSLYSLAAITLLTLVWQRRTFIVSLVSLASVPVWTWFGNVVRLTLIVWLLDTWNIDLSSGWKHTVLGFIVFAAVAGCMLLTIDALNSLLTRFSSGAIPRDKREWHLAYNRIVCWPGEPPKVKTDAEKFFGREKKLESASKTQVAAFELPLDQWSLGRVKLEWLAGFIAAVGLLFGGWSVRAVSRDTDLVASLSLPHIEESKLNRVLTLESMPERLEKAQRISFSTEHRSYDSFLGEYSRIWRYDFEGYPSLFSLDFPFRGFHGVWDCYIGSGQQLTGKPEIVGLAVTGLSDSWPVYRFELIDQFGDFGYVWFSLFDASNRAMTADRADIANLAVTAQVMQRIYQGDLTSLEDSPVTYQFQLYVPTGKKLTAEQQKQFLDLYAKALPIAVGKVGEMGREVKDQVAGGR